MQLKRLLTAFGLVLSVAAPAYAKGGDSGAQAVSRSSSSHGTNQTSKKKKRKHREPVFSGFQVSPSKLRSEPLPHPTGMLTLYSVNWRETVTVNLYNPDGSFNEESLAALNHFWRCRRTGTEKPIEPHLFEILSVIEDHYAGKTIELISGFRNQAHTSSFHFHGSASDIRVPGVAEKDLRDYVSTLDTGNMGLGLYPRSGFIHVDVRDEASYRWVDYSPPGGGEGGGGHAKKARKHRTT